MSFLNGREKRTLAAICETFIPALLPETDDDPSLFGCGAESLGVADQLEPLLEQVATAQQRRLLRVFFNVIEIGAFNRVTAGAGGAFSDLSLEQRTKIIRAWGNSSLPIARKTFQALKRASLFLFYALRDEYENNPAWNAFQYNIPETRAPDTPRPIQPLAITQDTTLYTDVLIIGSGAGGGVMAGELTAAGYDAIVVEKGRYYADSDFHGHEFESQQQMFERRGALATDDLSLMLLAGSTLGGGTTVNWSASMRPSDDVLYEWEHGYGFQGAYSSAFQHSLDTVSERIHVNSDESSANPQNAALERGCVALGYHTAIIPRNVRGCEVCDFCNFGCRFGAKQGTLKTYLQDAHERGGRILVNAKAERILHEKGAATGAVVTVSDTDGAAHTVTITARAVIAAGGAVQTPALLLRSGLGNANIGTNLHVHPVTVIYGQFEEPILAWQGPPMSRFSEQFANLDGRGYGVRLETAPVHPGIAALTLPWQSGRQHKHLMQKLHHLANIIIIARDYYGGRVTIDRSGEPRLHYRLSPYDANHLMRGLLEAMRVQRAAGAVEISSPHNKPLLYHPGDGNFEDYLEAVRARGFHKNAYALFSAHQMSSARIAGDSARGAFDPTGESYELRNLFIGDGSALPTASGVNPMLTIMGTAHFIAQHIKSKL